MTEKRVGISRATSSSQASELGQITFEASLARQYEQATAILQQHKEVEDKVSAHQLQLKDLEEKLANLQKKRSELLKEKRKGLLRERYKQAIVEKLVAITPTETTSAPSSRPEDPLAATDSEIAKFDTEKKQLQTELTQLTAQKELLYQQADQLSKKILDQKRYKGAFMNVEKGKLPSAKVNQMSEELKIEPDSSLPATSTTTSDGEGSVVAPIEESKDILEHVEQPKKIFSIDIDYRSGIPSVIMQLPFREDSTLYKQIQTRQESSYIRVENSEIDIKAKAGAGSLVLLCEKHPEQGWSAVLKQEYMASLPDELKNSNRISIKVGRETLGSANEGTAIQSRQKEVGSKILGSIDGVDAPTSVIQSERVEDPNSQKPIDAFVEITEYVPKTGYQVLQEKNSQSAELFDVLSSVSSVLDKVNLTFPIEPSAVDFSKLSVSEYNRLADLRAKLMAIDKPAKQILVDLIKKYLRAWQPLKRLSKDTSVEGFNLESDVFGFLGSTKSVPDFLYRDDGTLVRIDQSVVVADSFSDSDLETVILPYMAKMQEGIAWNESTHQWESPAGTLPGADTFSRISLDLLEDASWLPAEKKNEEDAKTADAAKERAVETSPVSYDQLSLADKKYFDSTEILNVFKSENPTLVQFLMRKEKKQVDSEEITFHTLSVTTTEAGQTKTRFLLVADAFGSTTTGQEAVLRKKGFSDKLNGAYINAYCKEFTVLEEAQNYFNTKDQ